MVVVGTVVLLVVGIRALLRGRRVPTKAKLVMVGAIVWLLSPVDGIPDVLPAVGVLDDLVVLVAAVRYLLDHLSEPEPVIGRVARRAPVEPHDWRLGRGDDRHREVPGRIQRPS